MPYGQEIKSVELPKLLETLPNMTGKNVAVTGTTSGTGFIFAREVAALGGRVLLLNRPSERSTKSLASLKEAVPSGKFEPVDINLQSFASVREASKKVNSLCESSGGLDVLCNNAGVMALEDKATKDGYDVQMQTNHLSHFLLTKLVFSSLKKASETRGEARIVNHTSGARLGAPIDTDSAKYFEKNGGNLGGDKAGWLPFTGPRWDRYHFTKLANCVFTYALKEQIEKTSLNIKCFIAHPGFASTNLQVTTNQDGGMPGGWIFEWFLSFLFQSAEDGTCGILKAACAKQVESGDFFGPRLAYGPPNKIIPEDYLYRKDSMDLLWKLSCEAVEESWEI